MDECIYEPHLLRHSKSLNFKGDWSEYERFVYEEMQLWKFRINDELEELKSQNLDKCKSIRPSIFGFSY